MAKFKIIGGSITSPQGFLTAARCCDLKKIGTGKGSNKGEKRDLALIFSEVPAKAAGMFTTNQICAAPVKICIKHLKNNSAQAVVVNSGNANACTGPQGIKDALEMATITANKLGLRDSDVLVGSTGRIGVNLPMHQIRKGISTISEKLKSTQKAACQTAEAIMTSDTKPKQISVEFKLGGKTVRLGGIAKGAGMIQPGMSPNGTKPCIYSFRATRHNAKLSNN